MIRKTLFIATLLLIFSMAVFGQESISVGDTVEGTLTTEAQPEYTFEATEGETVLISLVSDDFDTLLTLLDADGSEITTNDDGGDGLNSLINFTPDADGNYIIQVSSFDSSAEGAYSLSVMTVESNNIAYGDVIESDGALPNMLFVFDGKEGDLIVANLSAEGYDTYIEMTNPEGYNVGNSSYIDGLNTRLGPYLLEEDGTYSLNIRAEGDSVLSLNTVTPTELTIGESATAEFADGTKELYFSINVESNEVVDLVVDSGNLLDTKMDIISPYGYITRSVDDGVATVDPSASGLLLDTEGTYYIALYASNPNATLTGEVTVSLSETELASLEDGSTELTFDFQTNEQVVTFEGVADERVTLSIEVETEESYTTPFIEITQDSEQIATYSQNNIKSASVTFVVPADGEVSIAVQVYSEAIVRLTLDRGE